MGPDRIAKSLMVAVCGLLFIGAVSECVEPYPPLPPFGSLSISQMSPDGSYITFSFGNTAYSVLVDGTVLNRLPAGPSQRRSYFAVDKSPNISPDGSRVAYSTFRYSTGLFERVHSFEIATSNPDGTEPRRLTKDEHRDAAPVWSPDGDRIAFVSWRKPAAGIYSMDADGSDIRFIAPGAISLAPQIVWSPDGSHIAFRDFDLEESGGEINLRHFVATVAADGSEFIRVMESDTWISEPAWSPDGERIAFNTTEDGHTVLYVADRKGTDISPIFKAPRPGAPGEHFDKYQHAVWWSPDGSEIRFYAHAPEMGLQSIHPDGTGFSTLQRGLTPEAGTDFSADGSRHIVDRSAMRDDGVVLYTAAPDGSDRRVLVRYVRERFVAENSDWQTDLGIVRDIAACSEGKVVSNPRRNPGLVRDCETLLRMRDTLAGEDVVLRWDRDRPIDRWEGVTIGGDPPRVVGLGADPNYIHTDLEGTIPPEIGELTELQKVEFLGDSMDGPIPPELGKLTELETLMLVGIGLHGEVPAELGNLKKLKFLAIHRNHLEGCLPAALADNLNLDIMSELDPC